MSILFTIFISLLLGYSMGVQHERKKYICLDEPDEDGEIVYERPKESFFHRAKKSIKKNLF